MNYIEYYTDLNVPLVRYADLTVVQREDHHCLTDVISTSKHEAIAECFGGEISSEWQRSNLL